MTNQLTDFCPLLELSGSPAQTPTVGVGSCIRFRSRNFHHCQRRPHCWVMKTHHSRCRPRLLCCTTSTCIRHRFHLNQFRMVQYPRLQFSKCGFQTFKTEIQISKSIVCPPLSLGPGKRTFFYHYQLVVTTLHHIIRLVQLSLIVITACSKLVMIPR